MDEQEFKSAYAAVNQRPCVFAKAILRRCAHCSRSERLFIAEREAVGCKSPGSRQRCEEVQEMFRAKFLFALRLRQTDGQLPHGKEIKLECGGLLGLQAAMNPSVEGAGRVPDIHLLLEEVLTRSKGLDDLPFGEIIKHVTSYRPRGRRSPKGHF